MHPFRKVIGKRVMCVFPWKANAEIKSAGGIIIPDEGKDKPAFMKVALSGLPEIKEGDTVCYNKYHGTTVTIDNQEYLFLKEEEILGVM